MTGHLEVVGDERELAELVAERFVSAARAAIVARGFFAVALAGGSTPKAAYDVLAQRRAADVDWQFVRFYFGDERCVPPDHADSNFRMAREHLFTPLGIAPEAIYRMRGEETPEAAAEEYEALVRDSLGSEPIFDLVMLGMGPDGHTASLFPGTLEALDAKRLVVANFVPKLDTHRITLTPRALNAARAIEVATAGEGKADALNAVLHGFHDPDTYPSQALEPTHGTLSWLVDRAAAAKLESPPMTAPEA